MAQEVKTDADKLETMIRATILSGGPELYSQVYGDEAAEEERRKIEEEVEWMTPNDIDEIKRILASEELE
jgi:hypothetical protein